MARFPNREPDIMVLAQDIARGFQANPDIFPNPPCSMEDLNKWLTDYTTDRDAYSAAQAKAAETLAHKQQSFEVLTDAMKALLRYAESAASSDQQLALIGWSGRSTPTALQPPGQPRLLEMARQGAAWISLDWKAAQDGGKASAYNTQRRLLPDGAWSLVGTSVDPEITLTDQPRGQTLEYRVLAINRAGTSEASNIVSASL